MTTNNLLLKKMDSRLAIAVFQKAGYRVAVWQFFIDACMAYSRMDKAKAAYSSGQVICIRCSIALCNSCTSGVSDAL